MATKKYLYLFFSLMLLAIIVLLAYGFIAQASTSFWVNKDTQKYLHLYKHSIFTSIGILLILLLVFVPLKLQSQWIHIFYLTCIGMLILCYVPGFNKPEYGSYRWIKTPIPFFASVQPSEMAKLALVTCLAWFYYFYQTERRTWLRGFVIPCCIAVLPVALIINQKDFGTAMIISATVLAIMWIAGTKKRYLLFGVLAGILAVVALVISDENRMRRIYAHENREETKSTEGYQQDKAASAIKRGSINGVGIGNSIYKLGKMPFPHTDFIFAIVAEELGFYKGTLVVLLCFILFFTCAILITTYTQNLFYKLMITGCSCLIAIPAIINVGVVIRVLPNTGLPLTFISYGGTNLLCSLLAFGCILRCYRNICREFKGQESHYGKQHREVIV